MLLKGLRAPVKARRLQALLGHLQAKGIRAETVREPGGTPLAEALRELVKQQWQENVSSMTELLLMYASRVQLVDNVIKPALQKNRWVIGDCRDLSSQAYQGGGQQLGAETLKSLKQLTLGDFELDLTPVP